MGRSLSRTTPLKLTEQRTATDNDTTMQHRHLHPGSLSLAAIADMICRGGWQDWIDLRGRVLASTGVLAQVQRVCKPHLDDGYAQRYHFWMNYAKAHEPAATA